MPRGTRSAPRGLTARQLTKRLLEERLRMDRRDRTMAEVFALRARTTIADWDGMAAEAGVEPFEFADWCFRFPAHAGRLPAAPNEPG